MSRTFRDTECTLSEVNVRQMLQEHNFFDCLKYPTGQGIAHLYVQLKYPLCIYDLVTDLTWQQRGNIDPMPWDQAHQYIEQLNKDKYATYDDWRLPTLEEAMSLVEQREYAVEYDSMYVNSIFHYEQRYIWTVDRSSYKEKAWVVFLFAGCCCSELMRSNNFVRAVRSGLDSQVTI